MKDELDATKRIAGTYKHSSMDDEPELDARNDIAEIITDN